MRALPQPPCCPHFWLLSRLLSWIGRSGGLPLRSRSLLPHLPLLTSINASLDNNSTHKNFESKNPPADLCLINLIIYYLIWLQTIIIFSEYLIINTVYKHSPSGISVLLLGSPNMVSDIFSFSSSICNGMFEMKVGLYI